jgi:hypothetical protein
MKSRTIAVTTEREGMSRGFFEEPFDLAAIDLALSDKKFFMAAYVLCGQTERWRACAQQLRSLFMAFVVERGLDDGKLLQLAALMWRWAGRLPDRVAARQYLLEQLDFISRERLQLFVNRQFNKDGWLHPPWMPR